MADTETRLARHGETEWSRDMRHTGHTDVPLTDLGREQARALGTPLSGLDLALVLTSPLSRATETCQLAGLGDHAVEDPDLIEWDYGEYEGLTTDEIRRDVPGWTIWDGRPPGGETVEQVGERADRVIARLSEAGGPCAVFAHGHILRLLAARWIGLPPASGALLALSTGTLSGLGHERERRVVTLWNDGSHLAAA